MGTYDFAIEEQDVWHAFSAAIVMMKAREYLVGLKENGQLGDPMEDEEETDVDA